MRRILVLGGGASGMTAAIAAAAAGADVTLLEGGAKPGKKLLVTGNGRCNLTNRALDPARYRGSCRLLAAKLLQTVSVEDTLRFFESLGVPTVTLGSERGSDRYVYPRSREASCVREALERECLRLGVRILTETKAERISRNGDGSFTVRCGSRSFSAERVILAAGGAAAPKTGSDGSGPDLARQLGCRVRALVPALGALETLPKPGKAASGVRTEATLTLTVNGETAGCETGELQLTEYGLSGIPVFQLSGAAAEAVRNGKTAVLSVDFWPEQELLTLQELLSERCRRNPAGECGDLLAGMLPWKLCTALLSDCGLALHRPLGGLKKAELQKLSVLIKRSDYRVTADRGFENAQVTAGGVCAEEVTDRLESGKLPGLFFAGELLDVDGPCGGYNLQWAWTSGTVAGRAAAED